MKTCLPEAISMRTLGLSCKEEDFARQKQKLLWHTELPKKKGTALWNSEHLSRDWMRGPGKAIQLSSAQPVLMGVVALGLTTSPQWCHMCVIIYWVTTKSLILRILFLIVLSSPSKGKIKFKRKPISLWQEYSIWLVTLHFFRINCDHVFKISFRCTEWIIEIISAITNETDNK